jgi:hypothetical protein
MVADMIGIGGKYAEVGGVVIDVVAVFVVDDVGRL